MATRAAATRPMGMAIDWPLLAFAVALPLGIAARVLAGWGAPFWFDETFTAVIATQPSFAALVRWCLGELTGPAYYMPMWAWQKLAGPSDAAFRLPGLALSVAAALLLAWRGHPDRTLRLFWATLALVWLPALPAATDARPYPQLFFLGCVQATAFLAAMRDPTRRQVLGWSAASAALALTHYYPLVLVVLQGAALTVRHPRSLRIVWPALLPFAVVAGWLAFHLPFLLGFAHGQAAAQAPLPPGAVAMLPALLFGVSLHGVLVLGTIAATVLRWRPRPTLPRSPEAMLALTGIAAFALVFAGGLVRAGFAPRYLTPFMPAVLFAVAWWARRVSVRDAMPAAIVVATLLLAAAGVLGSALTDRQTDGRHLFSAEAASAWIAGRTPDRLVFLWDSPIGAISGGDHLAEVAGFFLHRAGQPVPVTMARAPAGVDPNAAVAAAAGTDRRTATLWMAAGPSARERLPRPGYDTLRECREFGGGDVTVLACRPRP